MNILYIKATPRNIEDSWSLKMADFFRQEYQKAHPDHVITELSLYDAAIPFLSQQDLVDMMQEEKGEFAHYVDQFLAHDAPNSNQTILRMPVRLSISFKC